MELILELAEPELDVLRKTFLHNNGLTLTEFCQTLLELLPKRFSEPGAIVQTIQQLEDAFQQIDVNGDQNLEWEELMGALLDVGSAIFQKKRAPYFWTEVDDASRSTPHSTRLGRVRLIPELSIMCVCEEGRQGILFYNLFGETTQPDVGLHPIGFLGTAIPGVSDGGEVFDMSYDAATQILICTVGDFSLQFYDCKPLATREVVQNEPLVSREDRATAREELTGLSKVLKRGGHKEADETILQAALGALQASNAIRGGSAGNNGSSSDEGSPLLPMLPAAAMPCCGGPSSRLPRYITRVHTHTPQRGILYVPDAGRLMTYGVGKELHVWAVKLQRINNTEFEVRCSLKATLKAHDDQITEMVLLQDVGLLATAGLDGNVCLWAIKGAPDGAGGRRGFNDDANIAQQAMAATHGLYLHTKHTGIHVKGVRSML